MYNTYYIYIMSNTKDTVLYIGMTNDLKRRVEEHKSNSIPGFTQKYCCHKLVYYETYSDVNQAKFNRFFASLRMTRGNIFKQNEL